MLLKDSQLNSSLYDTLLARFKKKPHHDYLIDVAGKSNDGSGITKLIVSQNLKLMGESDVNWGPWEIWTTIYSELVDEGLLNPKDTDPELSSNYDLREHFSSNRVFGKRYERVQKSKLTLPSDRDGDLALESKIDRHTVFINLDYLALHLTKARVEKLAQEFSPNWTTKITSTPLLVSAAKLTTQDQAKELATKLKKKVADTFKVTIADEKCIYDTFSRSEPGVFRVVIDLGKLNLYCPPIIPDEPIIENPFKAHNEEKALSAAPTESKLVNSNDTAPTAGRSNSTDVIQSLGNYHLVLQLKQQDHPRLAEKPPLDETSADKDAAIQSGYSLANK